MKKVDMQACSRKIMKGFFVFAALTTLSFGAGCPPGRAESFPKSLHQTDMDALLTQKKSDPDALYVFLKKFPKGSDLHNHLVGAVYAESFLNWAEADNNCVSFPAKTILASSCPTFRSQTARPASDLMERPEIWNRFIDAMSMRHFRYHAGSETGHDHFFNSFQHFAGIKPSRTGLAHAFLEGKSLWKAKVGGKITSACRGAMRQNKLTSRCQKFLEKNEKAKLQWNLEKRFYHFEREQLFQKGK